MKDTALLKVDGTVFFLLKFCSTSEGTALVLTNKKHSWGQLHFFPQNILFKLPGRASFFGSKFFWAKGTVRYFGQCHRPQSASVENCIRIKHVIESDFLNVCRLELKFLLLESARNAEKLLFFVSYFGENWGFEIIN